MVWVFESQERHDAYQRCADVRDDWPLPKQGELSEKDLKQAAEWNAEFKKEWLSL